MLSRDGHCSMVNSTFIKLHVLHFMVFGGAFSGLYYKRVTIVIDTPSVVSK
jgi:hypothetical protein